MNHIAAFIRFSWPIILTVAASVVTITGAIAGIAKVKSLFRQPKMSHQTAVEARATVDKAAWVINHSINHDGRIGHPWRHPEGDLDWAQLRGDLETTKARVSRKNFSGLVDVLVGDLEGIWANRMPRKAAMGSSGAAPSAAEASSASDVRLVADRQLAHARAGAATLDALRQEILKLTRFV